MPRETLNPDVDKSEDEVEAPVQNSASNANEEPHLRASLDSGSSQIMPGRLNVVSSESSRSHISPTVSTSTTTSHERKGRFTITPALDDEARASVAPKVPTAPVTAESVPNERSPLLDGQGDSQYLGSDEPPSDSYPNPNGGGGRRNAAFVRLRRNFVNRYIEFSNRVADSVFIVPALLMLLALSCFACYMGIAYLHKCDLMAEMPILLIFLGVSGSIALASRIFYIFVKLYSLRGFRDCRCLTGIGIVSFMLMYFTALGVFHYVGSPSTEHGPNFCDPVFYSYVYWNNWTTALTVIVLSVAHSPSICTVERLI